MSADDPMRQAIIVMTREQLEAIISPIKAELVEIKERLEAANPEFITAKGMMTRLGVKSHSTMWKKIEELRGFPSPATRNPLKWTCSDVDTYFKNC